MAYDEELADRVRDLMSHREGYTEQKMFGGIGFMLHGHMAVGVSGQGGLMLRVPPDRTAELLTHPGAEPFEMRGRGMSGWLRVSPEALQDDAALGRWAEIGIEFVSTMPPK